MYMYRGGSAGRVDATRGRKHRGLEHAGEKTYRV
jgi:hypothetical protein